MVRYRSRRDVLAAAARAGAVAAAAAAGGAQSELDRHFLSRSMVHHPVDPGQAPAAADRPTARPIASVPTDGH